MIHGWRGENGGGETNERPKEAEGSMEAGQPSRARPAQVGHEEEYVHKGMTQRQVEGEASFWRGDWAHGGAVKRERGLSRGDTLGEESDGDTAQFVPKRTGPRTCW